MRASLRAAVCLAGMPFLAFPALGQSGVDASVVGTVTDTSGDALSGVSVLAHSPSGAMAAARAVTDTEGRYRIAPLPPRNDYVLTAERAGYASVELGPVDLDPGRTTQVDFSLRPTADATERVVVDGKGDALDLARNGTSTVFDSESLARADSQWRERAR